MKIKGTRCNVMNLCLVFVLTLAISGCKSTRGWVIDAGVNSAADDLIVSLLDIKSLKLVKKGIPGNALLLSSLAELAPNSKKMLSLCSMLYVSYALMIFEENQDYAMELCSTGAIYGERALRLNDDIREGLDKGMKFGQPTKTIEEVKKELGKDVIDFEKDMPLLIDYAEEDDLEAVTWTALNMGLRAGIGAMFAGDMSAMAEFSDVIAMIKKSREIDPDYFFGITTLVLAVYYAIVPKLIDPAAGLESSEAMFAEAARISGGNFVILDVARAAIIAPLKKDEELFMKLLKGVIESDSSIPKGACLLNELAKDFAKKILENKDKFF